MMIAGRCPAVSIASYPTNPAHVCKITMSVHARITCVKFGVFGNPGISGTGTTGTTQELQELQELE